MSVEVRIAEGEELNWDSLIASSPFGTIFHTLRWLRIAEKYTKSKLYPLIGVKGDNIVGVFPVFYKKKGMLRAILSPPPRTGIPYMGPVLSDYERLKQEKRESLLYDFVRGVDSFIHEHFKPHYIYIKMPPGLNDCRPFKWSGYHANPVYSYLLDISIGLSDIEASFSIQARRNIKQAMKKEELKFEEGSEEELEILYDMLFERYKEQNRKIPISKGYLMDLFNEYAPENMKIFVIRNQNGEIVSGGVKLCYKDRIMDWIGQPKTAVRTSNDFLHWCVIRWGVEHNLRYYEILGANTPTISKFKAKFNPSLELYFEMKKMSLIGAVAEKIYTKMRDFI